MISQLLSKSHINRLAILCISALLFACNSGSSASQSAQPVTAVVKSIYPANNDTDIGISTPIIVAFNTNIAESQISAKLVDINNQQISGAVALKISGNGSSIYTFTPDHGLLTNTTYKFTLQDSVASTTSPTSISTTFSTQPSYKIFTTTGGYKGNLRGSTTSAVTGADALCNADAANPDKSYYYKAMLTASSERYACVASNICGGLNSQDWVLQPYTGYYNLNNQLIESANGQSVFVFPLTLPFGLSGSDNVWTGLTDSWGSSGDGDSCKAWTSSSSDNKGKCGRSGQTGTGAISNDQQDCNGTRKLYCVMQPTTILVNPIKGSTTTNFSTTISVRFNMVGGVNSATVNTTTFSVIESSPYQVGVAIAGTISSNGEVFTFTPSAALKAGKTYNVSLSSGISSNNGVAISPTVFTFFTPGETKLIFATQDSWWGDLQEVAKKAGLNATSGITGADSLCGADPQCPAGKVCKAIISDNDTRIACVLSESGVPLCGSSYAKDWVLTADTDYVNTSGVFLGTTNSTGIFNFAMGFQFTTPLSSSGKKWTGLTAGWTSDNKGTCEKWTKGDSGVNQLGGLLGYPDTVDYRSIGSNNAGGCSQYNYQDDFGKYCYTDDIDGCSKRGLYCATQ